MTFGFIPQFSNKETFSTKLKKRLSDLGLCQIRKTGTKNWTPALVELHNKINPNDIITEDTDKNNKIDRYRDWINGKTTPDLEEFAKLCNALEVDSSYFFTDTEAPTRDICFISDALKLSPKAIEKLMCYDSGLKKILDALICTESKYASPDNTGIFEALLHQMWQYSYMMQANNIELRSDNLAPVHITDKEEKKQFFKKYPKEIFDSCLDIAEKIRREGD